MLIRNAVKQQCIVVRFVQQSMKKLEQSPKINQFCIIMIELHTVHSPEKSYTYSISMFVLLLQRKRQSIILFSDKFTDKKDASVYFHILFHNNL